MKDSAYVQKAQKETSYTVTSIGGAKELAEWKANRCRIEAAYQEAQTGARTERRQNAVSIVNGGSPARELTEIEKAELIHVTSRRESVRKLTIAGAVSASKLTTIDAPQPPKRLYDHFKTFVSNIWTNAFDSER